MAKSRKSGKATVRGEQGVEKPEEAEKIVSADETEATDATPAPESGTEDLPDVKQAAADSVETENVEPEEANAGKPEEHAAESSTDAESKDSETQPEAEETAGESAPESEEEGGAEVTAADAVDPDDAQVTGEADQSRDGATEQNAMPVPVAASAQTREARGSIWPGIFGGVIAAMIGFVVGRGDVIDEYLPSALQRADVDTTEIEAATEALAAKTEALSTQTTTLAAQTEEQTAALQAQAVRLDSLEEVSAASLLESLSALEADIAKLNQRLGAVESRPVASGEPSASPESVTELEAALAAQKAEIDKLAARTAEAEAQAASEAARILARAAMTRVMTAVESGETFAPALADLEETAPVEVPPALREAADVGVPTLAALQESFPDAARAGLTAARAEVPEAEVEGITGFLKRQLQVRSVTPREGDDPDAVLSRAQAAVKSGDLGTALSEMEALPEAAKSAMSDWLEAASARKAAQDAAQELADSLDSN